MKKTQHKARKNEKLHVFKDVLDGHEKGNIDNNKPLIIENEMGVYRNAKGLKRFKTLYTG